MQYRRLVADNARFLGFGFLLAVCSTFGQTFYIAMYGGALRADFALSHGDFGNIYAVGTLASGFILMWTGKFIDRIDLRVYAVCLSFLLAIACLTMSVAEGVLMLGLAIFLLRIAGQGLLSQAALVTMARYFDSKTRGRAVSIVALGFPVGQAIFPAASVVVLTALSWREAWLASAVLILLVAPPILLWMLRGHGARQAAFLERTARSASERAAPAATSAPASDRDRDTSRHWTRAQVLRDPCFLLAAPAMMAPSFIITGLNFHQVLLVEEKGWDIAVYASGFGFYAACHIGVSVITGMLIDRYGALKLTPYYMLPLALSCLVLASFEAPATVIAYMALAGMTGGAGASILSTVWVELYGVLHLGAIKAMVAGLSVISSALAPAAFGQLIDIGVSIEVIAVSCGIYGLLGCLVLAATFRPRLLFFWRP